MTLLSYHVFFQQINKNNKKLTTATKTLKQQVNNSNKSDNIVCKHGLYQRHLFLEVHDAAKDLCCYTELLYQAVILSDYSKLLY